LVLNRLFAQFWSGFVSDDACFDFHIYIVYYVYMNE